MFHSFYFYYFLKYITKEVLCNIHGTILNSILPIVPTVR